MTAYQIRQKARETLKALPGKYQLFSISIILAILSLILTVRETLLNMSGVPIADSASFFPVLVDLLLAVFLASASFSMLDVLRFRRKDLTFADNNLALSSPILGKLLATSLLRWLYLLPWALLTNFGLAIVYTGLSALLKALEAGADLSASLTLVTAGIVTALLGFILFTIKQYTYSMSLYILYDKVYTNTYLGPRNVLETSKQLTKGYKWKLFKLELSFLGWYALTACTFGLLYIYVLPYTTTAQLVFYDNRLAQLRGKE